MAIALAHQAVSNGGVSPLTVTITAPAAGNLLVCALTLVDHTITVSSVKQGTTAFTQATNARADNTALTLAADIWFLPNCGTGTSIVITLSGSSQTVGSVWVYEFSGADTGGTVFDVGNHANDLASAATLTGPTITTAISGEVIIAVVADSNLCTGSNAPYTFGSADTNGNGSARNITSGTVTNQTCVFTDSSSGAGCIAAAAFKPPSGTFTWQQLTTDQQPMLPKKEVVGY